MFKPNPTIFREYDIRGLAGKELSTEFAKMLGKTYAEWAHQHSKSDAPLTISVGRDCRLSSDELATALIEGLLESGINVISIGTCPTPLTYYSVRHLNTDGGIMVTGSHNPAEYNGFKIGFKNDTLHGNQIQELYSIMNKQKFTPRTQGKLSTSSIIPEYVQYVSQQIKPKRKLRVVLDAGNGTAATVAPLLFEAIGADFIPLYCTLDGRFPNHHPDPTVPKNLNDLIHAVKTHQADFGVGYDGDSDRIGAVDAQGKILYGDELMVIFSREVLKDHPNATIISEVKSSDRLYRDIAKNGGTPLMWKTGHSLIKSKMKETGAKLAGEMSGHIFFADRWFGFDDAIYASVRLYEIIANSGRSLADLISDLAPAINTPEIRLDCEDTAKFKLIEKTSEILSRSSALVNPKLTTIDGLRVDTDLGWGLIRASNTQPVIVMRFESKTENDLKNIQTVFMSALNQAASLVGHESFQF